jgi:hypothetical protein
MLFFTCQAIEDLTGMWIEQHPLFVFEIVWVD